LQKRYAKGGTCCPQRVGERIAALPPNICAFGNRRLPSSSEKSIHQKARNSRVASRVPDHFLTLLTLNPFAYGVGRGNGVGLGLGVGGGRVAVGVAVAVAVAVGVALAVGVGVGQPAPLLRCHTSLRNWKVAPSIPPTHQISPFP